LKYSFALAGILILIGAVAAVAWYGHRSLDLPVGEIELHHIVEIPPDASFKTVSSLLAQKGLIPSPFWFRILGKVRNAERKIKPGEYDFHTRMRPTEILNALIKGRVIQYSVLVPEGLTAQQISRLLDETGLVISPGITHLVSDRDFIKSLGIEAPNLEGYLFPDTYLLPRRSKPEDVVRTMVTRFRQLYTPSLQTRAAELNMTDRQVLTLASIIEKETGQDQERSLVSAVFHNRLRRNWPLQSDPTLIYGIPNFGGNLTREHLVRPGVYNTYLKPGLPPGPIANPGIKSIEAALYPAQVKYLFFVSKNDGTHQFSSTLEEHNRAVDHYQKKGARPNQRRKVL
jgi:peptidoglycan lytic transglycosylase G